MQFQTHLKLILIGAIAPLFLISIDSSGIRAQIGDPSSISPQVYAKLPQIPRENQYLSRETGKAASQNTLVTRLIRYHAFVKGRSPISRLDWKLTIADYLGFNEFQEESTYPGYDSLKENPLKGDRAAIERLSRQQRDRLIAVLLGLFGTPNATSRDRSTPSVSTPRPSLILPEPGDAKLLKP